jgi:hypothetical protein
MGLMGVVSDRLIRVRKVNNSNEGELESGR